MTQLSSSAFIAKYGDDTTGEFPTNTSQVIGSENLRNQAQDIADSVYFKQGDNSFTEAIQVQLPSIVVLNANSAPVEIVPAPGSGNIIMPVMFEVYLDYNSAAYAGNTTFRFEINGVAVSSTNTTTLPGTADRYTLMLPTAFDTTTNLQNQPLVFEVQTGNPTTGNSPIYVKCVYKIFSAIYIPSV